MACCHCYRSILQIEEDGCARCYEPGQADILTPKEARRKKLERTRLIAHFFE